MAYSLQGPNAFFNLVEAKETVTTKDLISTGIITGNQGNFADVVATNIYYDNLIPTPGIGPTGPTGPIGPIGPNVVCTKRYNVEPNDPNGLLINATDTNPGPYYLPLVFQTGAGLGTCFDIDPDNRIQFIAPDKFQCNVEGSYNISISLPVLTIFNNQCVIAQILINGESIFTSPPAFTTLTDTTASLYYTPITAFSNAGILNGGANVYLNQGDVISIAFFLDTGDVVIAYLSEVSINLNVSSGTIPGPTGPTGPSVGINQESFTIAMNEDFVINDDNVWEYVNVNFTDTVDTGAFPTVYTGSLYQNLTTGSLNLSGNGIFTVGTSGTYFYSICITDKNPLGSLEGALIVNDDKRFSFAIDTSSASLRGNFSSTVFLNSGDTVKLQLLTYSTVPATLPFTVLDINSDNVYNVIWSMSLQGGYQGMRGPTGPSGAPSFEGFNVHLSSDQSVGSNTDIGNWAYDFSSAYFTSPNFDLVSGIYTAPQAGNYFVEMESSGIQPLLTVNGVNISYGSDYGIAQVIHMNQGDALSFQSTGGSTSKINNGAIATWFSVSLQTGIVGPTGPGAVSFEGISVVLASDIINYASGDIGNWAVPSSNYYTNGNFNLSTGQYTVPASGYYNVNCSLYSPDTINSVYIALNGNIFQEYEWSYDSELSNSINSTNYFNSGDVLSIQALPNSGTITISQLSQNGNIGTWLQVTAMQGAMGPTGPAGVVQSIVAGNNVNVDNTDPANPVVSVSCTRYWRISSTISHLSGGGQIPIGPIDGNAKDFAGLVFMLPGVGGPVSPWSGGDRDLVLFGVSGISTSPVCTISSGNLTSSTEFYVGNGAYYSNCGTAYDSYYLAYSGGTTDYTSGYPFIYAILLQQ